MKKEVAEKKLMMDYLSPVVAHWLPPQMLRSSDWISDMMKIRITFVDGSFQIYGHQKNNKHLLRRMKDYFASIYNLEDCPEHCKEEWAVGDACVTKLGNCWYRAQVIEVDQIGKEVAIIYVDLGNVSKVKCVDLRIPRAFGDQVYINRI